MNSIRIKSSSHSLFNTTIVRSGHDRCAIAPVCRHNLPQIKAPQKIIFTAVLLAFLSFNTMPASADGAPIAIGGGKIGIGTMSPANDLQVVGTMTAATIGIGTTNPAYKLDVNGGMRGAITFFPYDSQIVYSNSAPASYTDLNLSSIIGNAQAMVYLKLLDSSVDSNYAFRTKGETHAISYSSAASWFGGGASAMTINNGNAGYLWIMTDASGTVQWAATSSPWTTVYVEAYMR